MRNLFIRRYLIFFLFVFSIFLFSNRLPAQNIPFRFESLSIEDGLSQSKIYCIIQDRLGFMWFGTQDGLNMYNGYDFKIFRSEFGVLGNISDKQVISIYEDRQGYIWIGTYYGGLNRFDRSSGKFISYQFDPSNVNSLSNNTINSITETRNGELWIGTNGGGLNKLDRTSEKFTAYKYIPNDNKSISNDFITSIQEDRNGKLWVGTKDGLNQYDPLTNTFKRLQSNLKHPNSLSENVINKILIDHSGRLWVGTDFGLNLYDDVLGHITKYYHNPGNPSSISNNKVKSIYEDHFQRIWVGTEDGLCLFNKKTDSFTCFYNDPKNSKSLNENDILSICEERSGTMWIGTQTSGLNWFESVPKGFRTYRNIPNDPSSLNSNIIRCFCEESEEKGFEIWIGTIGGGLNLFNRRDNTFNVFKNNPKDLKSLSSNRVNSILKDKSGVLWIGTDKGLNTFDYAKKSFTHFNHNPLNPFSLSDNRINILYEDRKGELWIGTENGGLNKYDRLNNQFINYQKQTGKANSITDNQVRAILEDHNGVFWIGTLNGLNMYNPSKNEFTHFFNNPKDTNSISSNRILSIYEDKSHRLWIATVEGVNYFDRSNNRFIRYNRKNGFPNDIIYCFIEDNSGNLWISSNRGISKFNPISKKIKNFDINDGLQGNEFNYGANYKDNNGEMFFGGSNGFTIFHPDSIKENLNKPIVVLTDFKLFNKSVPIGEKVNGRIILKKSIAETKEIELSYRDYIITFEFAALHYLSPQKNEYTYTLEGLEDKWNNVGNRRFVTYSTLPSGKYTFKVKASNNDGIWSENGVEIKINILPPYWETWWFRSCVILLMGGSAILWYRNKINTIKNQKKILEIQVKERTAEIFEKNIELEKLSIVASETDNAVIIMDEQFNFEWVNDGFTKLYGISYDELVLYVGRNLIEGSKYENIREVTNFCKESKKSIRYENLLNAKDNRSIWVQTTLTPIIDDLGKIKKFVAIDSDITEIKQAEIAIKQQNEKIQAHEEELEAFNEELTCTNEELHYQREEILEQAEQLKKQNERLREMDEFKQGMTSMIVHDLKNPLNLILNVAKSVNPERQIQIMQQSGRQMLNLVLNILDVNKYEGSSMIISAEELPLARLLRNASDQVQFLCEQKGITVFDKVEAGVVVKADGEVIERVLVNLLTNAVKFTPCGGAVTISIHILPDSRVRIEVTDTGEGIAEDKMHLVFQRFGQIVAKKSGAVKSTGLGLAFCKMAAEAHGGEIGVRSEVGQGATFWFTLLLADAKQVELPAEEEAEEKKAEMLTFTAEEVKVLEPFIRQLKAFTVYETDDIEEILTQMKQNSSESIQKWVRRVEKSMTSLNQTLFSELLNAF